MNIATALNRKYVPYTIVMLTSLCENNNCHIDSYLLNSELDKEDINKVSEALSKYDISIIPVKTDRERFEERLPRNDQWSIEMYYRLLMPELMPDSVSRVLYLDVDIIVNKSLSDFYSTDFCGNELVVCDDKGGKNNPSGYGKKHQEMFMEAYENGHRYFNSGVMLVNLELLRHRYTFNTYLDAIKKWNYEMEAPDQDILNWVHWRNVGYVDYKVYDYFARVAHNDKVSYEQAKKSIAILHFAGAKPWEYSNFHYDIERLWWEYARKTPFYECFLEEFIQKAITDTTVEDYLTEITEINKKLNDSLNEMVQKMKQTVNRLET